MARRRRPSAPPIRKTPKPGRKGVPPVAVRGRPPRRAHLLPDDNNNKRRERALAALTKPIPSVNPTLNAGLPDMAASDASSVSDSLCLPHPEWLPQLLTVIGPTEDLHTFQEAARGPGHVAWSCDYHGAAEDWALQLLARPPAQRGISVTGARILAGQLSEQIERLDMAAFEGTADLTCPLDLNVLVPLPAQLLRLGPDDPAVIAWQWTHWGTTWMLRGVEEVPVGRAGILVPGDQAAVCFRFWSADWTPWRALETIRARWRTLSLHVKLLPVSE